MCACAQCASANLQQSQAASPHATDKTCSHGMLSNTLPKSAGFVAPTSKLGAESGAVRASPQKPGCKRSTKQLELSKLASPRLELPLRWSLPLCHAHENRMRSMPAQPHLDLCARQIQEDPVGFEMGLLNSMVQIQIKKLLGKCTLAHNQLASLDMN